MYPIVYAINSCVEIKSYLIQICLYLGQIKLWFKKQTSLFAAEENIQLYMDQTQKEFGITYDKLGRNTFFLWKGLLKLERRTWDGISPLHTFQRRAQDFGIPKL